MSRSLSAVVAAVLLAVSASSASAAPVSPDRHCRTVAKTLGQQSFAAAFADDRQSPQAACRGAESKRRALSVAGSRRTCVAQRDAGPGQTSWRALVGGRSFAESGEPAEHLLGSRVRSSPR